MLLFLPPVPFDWPSEIGLIGKSSVLPRTRSQYSNNYGMQNLGTLLLPDFLFFFVVNLFFIVPFPDNALR